jgi:ribulose-phosphate 3-epimerase
MVNHPETFIDSFSKAGADYITIHQEASIHLNGIIERIRENGKKPGISIVPSTPVSHIIELLPFVDLVLIMTVNPGFGGQSMIDNCLLKVTQLKEIKEKKRYNFLIEIDGGVNKDTYKKAIEAGSEVLVTGSTFFKSEDPAKYVNMLKSI